MKEYPRLENWGDPGMPPIYHEVLDRKVLHEGEQVRVERVWVKGHHVHLGTLIFGIQGAETEVTTEIVYPNTVKQYERRLKDGRARISSSKGVDSSK